MYENNFEQYMCIQRGLSGVLHAYARIGLKISTRTSAKTGVGLVEVLMMCFLRVNGFPYFVYIFFHHEIRLDQNVITLDNPYD